MRRAVGCEHQRDLVERETGGPAKRDQRQPIQYLGIEQPPQPMAADGDDETSLLVVA